MQDIGLDFQATGATPTMPTVDVTDTNISTAIGSVDFGSPTPLEIAYEWTQTMLANCVDFCYLQAKWSHDDSIFSDDDNFETVVVMQCTASTDKIKVGTFPTKARYAEFKILNESGGTLDFTSSNSVLELRDAFGDQV